MTFQIHALEPSLFTGLFDMSDGELKSINAIRVTADSKPGFPCRVSLADAEVGETLILVNFEHQPGESPYQSSHAVFVRENAEQAFPAVGEIPEVLKTRLISIRAFDKKHFMVAADVVEGANLAAAITVMFSDPATEYLHLHNAKPGCFAARVTRA